MSSTRLVIAGAGLAGLRAAEAARKNGHTGPLVLVGEEVHLPYDRPPLSKEFLDRAQPAKPDPHLREEHVLRDQLRLELHTGEAVTALDTEARRLTTSGGEIAYDQLVIATGAAARQLPGTDRLTGVLTLRTLDDARALRLALDASSRIVVIGAGFIGSEVASAARKRGLSATVVEAMPAPLIRSLGPEAGALCARLHQRNATDLRLSTSVIALHGRPGAVPDADGRRPVGSVQLSDGSTLEADLVVAGIGAAPATGWLEHSGVALHERDRGVLCDRTLQVTSDASPGSTIDGVWAAGDVAHWHNELFGQSMRLEHWTSAAEQGAIAARNALAGNAARQTYATVPYFWSDWYGTRLQFAGIPGNDEIYVQNRRGPHGGTVVLYRAGDHLTGTLTIGRPDLIMKYRRLIAQGCSWTAGVDFDAEHT